MMAYAEMRECRHARIADYFGAQGVARRCTACDNCLAERPPEEPIPAEAVSGSLAAIAGLSGRVGPANVAAALGGRQTKRSTGQGGVQHWPFPGAVHKRQDL